MKRVLSAIIAAIVSMVCVYTGYARTPSSITVLKDIENNRVKITVGHPTREPRKSFVRKVEVIVDDRQPIVKNYNFQRGAKRVLMLDIPDLEKAQQITVRAYPRQGKMLEKKFHLESVKELAPAQPKAAESRYRSRRTAPESGS